jgi:hypothetical protein
VQKQARRCAIAPEPIYTSILSDSRERWEIQLPILQNVKVTTIFSLFMKE